MPSTRVRSNEETECPREASDYCPRPAKQRSSPILQRHPCIILRPFGRERGKRQMPREIHGVRRTGTAARLFYSNQDRKPRSLCEEGFAVTVSLSTTLAWLQERTAGHGAQTRRRFQAAARI